MRPAARRRWGFSVELTRSAHVDTFCRDHLPPPEQWPEFLFDLPGLSYPERLNCASALLDDVIAAHGPERRCLRTDDGSWSYGELLGRANHLAIFEVSDFIMV